MRVKLVQRCPGSLGLRGSEDSLFLSSLVTELGGRALSCLPSRGRVPMFLGGQGKAARPRLTLGLADSTPPLHLCC